MVTEVPGPRSVAYVDVLARHESPGITARRARAGEGRGLGADPIVWQRARGANVWDEDGNRYVDLTGAFGVALIGHSHPDVVDGIQDQSSRLLHAMGDVYPNGPRIVLMERLAALAPPGLDQSILGTSGSEAVEAAMKTAVLRSGRPGVLAFSGSYHGLSYGALAATAYKSDFRDPFVAQLGDHVVHAPYGEELGALERLVTEANPGAVLVEPILGRGGVVVPPEGWLGGLRDLCDRHQMTLIFDEVYTGLGRTGRWWAGDHEGVIPDVLCVGKALGGGMPISAAIATTETMAAWRRSEGEAIHTSTFLGHPVAAAAALATLDVLEAMDAPAVARRLEARIRERFPGDVMGRGAMVGIRTEGSDHAASATGTLLRQGFLVLPAGVHGNVIALTPPLCITSEQLGAALDALAAALGKG